MLSSFDLGQYMRLDAAAVRALNLLPSTVEGTRQLLTVLLNLWKKDWSYQLKSSCKLKKWKTTSLMDVKHLSFLKRFPLFKKKNKIKFPTS
jgi:hypothetical protein